MDQVIIEPLAATRVRSAIAVLADAFRDDPIFCFHFPDARLRRKVLELFFGDVIRSHLRFDQVHAAREGETLIGAAVWRPPDGRLPGIEAHWRGMILRLRLLALSARAGHKLLQGFARLEATHPAAPHWYLFFIGIDAGGRGRGLGARLMAPVLQKADAAGMPCYLETPFVQTLPFYRGLGYEVVEEPRPFPGAPSLWAMMRKPRAPNND